ncbi:MAG: radical SAM protein [Candidatus Hadarchaeum sp.]|uniref:radical SAM protein n=1 Tax=Candidatus Hadarchaeum sp. TaxID=2883567 RepID=UPI003D0CA71A
MAIVYGPVSSWRLGRSLGVDPICQKGKICSFDCIYCSLGPTTEKSVERRVFVTEDQVARALKRAVNKVRADVVTFSGTGEPTLARNLGQLIDIAREISGLPVAVLTNSSLKIRREVREDLAKADIVKGKLDVSDEQLLQAVNRPHSGIYFHEIVEGLKKFRAEFRGRFQLEVMLVPENMKFSREIAKIAKEINPDEVQLNTPLRPSRVRPLTLQELTRVQDDFVGMNVRSVYLATKPRVEVKIGRGKLRWLKRAKE